MVAFARVLHHELPVAAFDQSVLVGDFRIRQSVGRQHWFEVGLEIGEVGWCVGEAHVDAARDRLDMDGSQGVAAHVEIRRHVARRQEFALQAVHPLMVGADQPRLSSDAGGADLRAAMPARVMESAQHAVRASHQHHGRASHQERQGAPRLPDLDLEPGEKPAPLEDGLQVEGERIGVVVEGLREAVAGPARPHQGFDLEFLEHASPRSMCDAAAIRIRRVAAAAPTISRSVRTGRPSGGPTQTDGSPVRTGRPTR